MIFQVRDKIEQDHVQDLGTDAQKQNNNYCSQLKKSIQIRSWWGELLRP